MGNGINANLDIAEVREQLNLVEIRSQEKHSDSSWWEMKFRYMSLKMLSHLLRHYFAGRGNYDETNRAHHLMKIIWYALRMYWMEENMAINDDRPYSPATKMEKKYIENWVKTKLDEI